MKALAVAGLLLEPLTVAHAEAMFELLSDPELYRYLDDPPPPDLEHVRQQYARLERRASPDGKQAWLNWVLREPGHTPIGYVQATVLGHGHASKATAAMLEHLESEHGVTRQLAIVEVDNLRSIRLLERLGFRAATAAELAKHEPTATERIFVRSARPPAGRRLR